MKRVQVLLSKAAITPVTCTTGSNRKKTHHKKVRNGKFYVNSVKPEMAIVNPPAYVVKTAILTVK